MKSVTIKCNSKQDSALMHHALKLDLKVTTAAAARRENKSFFWFSKNSDRILKMRSSFRCFWSSLYFISFQNLRKFSQQYKASNFKQILLHLRTLPNTRHLYLALEMAPGTYTPKCTGAFYSVSCCILINWKSFVYNDEAVHWID